MFFKVPDDLTNLDISAGQCYNASIPQNVTFGYQGLPFGLSTGNGKKGAAAKGLSGSGEWWRMGASVGLALVGAAAFAF